MERDAERTTHTQGLKYIPSFNDFAGDVDLGPETDQQSKSRDSVDTTLKSTAQTTDEPNPWRSVFDPASNPKSSEVGSMYYDIVRDPKQEPSTWDYIIKAEQLNKSSFYDIDQNKDGSIDKAELTARFGGRYDTDALLKQADRDNDGKISQDEFREVLNVTSA